MHDEEGNELEDKPRWISEQIPFFSLGADRAKSTARYNAMDPNMVHDGDFGSLIGAACNVTLTLSPPNPKYENRQFNNVASVSPVRKKDADKMPELVNDGRIFSMDDPDMEVFKSLPEWIQKEIKKSLEYNTSELFNVLEGGQTEDQNEETGEPEKDEPVEKEQKKSSEKSKKKDW